jgi:molybdenum cofactor cytidylyltransferase
MKNKPYSLSIILLAAGDSKRYNGNKMLVKIGEKPMYLHIVDEIKDILACQKVLVTQYSQIIDYLSDSGQYGFIKVVKNNHSYLGISHSIGLGIAACLDKPMDEEVCQGYLFAVCDQPWLKKKSILKLIDAFFASEKGIACLSYKGKLGNPVIFRRDYLKELKSLDKDVGGKFIVNQHRNDVELVEVEDELELLDIDTVQNQNWRKIYENFRR